MHLLLAFRLDPMATTVSIAFVMRKEVGNPGRSQVRGSVLARGVVRNDGWVCENHTLGINSALDITQQHFTSRNMVGEVRQGLHGLPPVEGCVTPPRVGVELLKVGDIGFDEQLCATELGVSRTIKCPDFRNVDMDHLANDSLVVPELSLIHI